MDDQINKGAYSRHVALTWPIYIHTTGKPERKRPLVRHRRRREDNINVDVKEIG